MYRGRRQKIICLSNVFDQQYEKLRSERIAPCLSSGKRRDLYRCLEMASGREVLVLSSPPKAASRRTPKWLKGVRTRFSTHTQLFCPNWDCPKLRIPLSWCFYAFYVFRNVRSGDIVLIDNYEFIYVIAARFVSFFKRVSFVLEYEDGKHLIDRSWDRVLSAAAEWLGKPLIEAAILAHPSLGERLSGRICKEIIPGFIVPKKQEKKVNSGVVRFLYSGTLDSSRGLEILLEALNFLPEAGWRLDITGAGSLEDRVRDVVRNPIWNGKVCFHGTVSVEEFEDLLLNSHVGINCQKVSDPISAVTFPSKIFTYLSANLVVISSKASSVDIIVGEACLYYAEETPNALAVVMHEVISDLTGVEKRKQTDRILNKFSLEGTALRMKGLLATLKL